jgi:hypothetical protein
LEVYFILLMQRLNYVEIKRERNKVLGKKRHDLKRCYASKNICLY